MPIHYASPHHSPEDPGGLIHEALSMGAAFPGPAEDLLLAWTLRLAPELDPQQAARHLLERYALTQEGAEGEPLARLVALLEQTAEQGMTWAGAGRRRGGWRSRRA